MNEKIKKDFEVFLGSSAPISENITLKIKKEIYRDLQPVPLFIYLKCFVIHVLASAITLLFCPQFGVGYFGNDYGLSAIAMKYGSVACAAACGSLFLSTSMVALLILLPKHEIIFLKKHKSKVLGVLLSLSLFFLLMFSTGQHSQMSSMINVEFIGLWSAFAFMAGWSILKLHEFFIHE